MAESKKQYVFGLDIGTRSVVGTVGYLVDDRFKVICQRTKEHETRAMIDGQIHDIIRVAETIREIKAECEEFIGEKLTRVCIAAAGRVLRTVDAHIDIVFEEERETKTEDVSNILLLGVDKAYKELSDESEKFYCVGYSPVRFYLNDLVIGNLVGHKARKIGVDMIATFLPDDVVDGLYKAVELADLEVANLTLEPIAAISVAIPERFRMLNIALVDVGAGTSDISITCGGSIIAYGMIPVAGDALTDELSQHYLADFYMAERVKREATSNKEITFEDIMGISRTVTSDEVKEAMSSKIDEMTTLVAEEIKRLNGGKTVSAVFIVGGGGLALGYTDALADKLGLLHERVALRGSNVLGKIDFEEEDLSASSLMVTPVGICLNYYENNNNLIYVTFNGMRIKLYDNGHVAVVDAAVQSGFPNDGLFPKRGQALTFNVNGKSKIMKGEPGESAVITVNEEPAYLTTKISPNDKIKIVESTPGYRARARIKDLPEFKEGLKLVVDGKTLELTRPVYANGEIVSPDYEIVEGDEIKILDACTKEQLLNVIEEPYSEEGVSFEAVKEPPKETPVYDADENDDAEDGASSSEPEKKETQPEKKNPSINVWVNKEPVTLVGKPYYIFLDVFNFIDFDLNNPKGKSIVTLHNGENARYMNTLNDGDILEIYWKD